MVCGFPPHKEWRWNRSVNSTILLQLKPLGISKFPVVFLFSGSCRYNQQKPAKTGSMKQNLRKNYGKTPAQRWTNTDVDRPLFDPILRVLLEAYRSFYAHFTEKDGASHIRFPLASFEVKMSIQASFHTLHTLLPNSWALLSPNHIRVYIRVTYVPFFLLFEQKWG